MNTKEQIEYLQSKGWIINHCLSATDGIERKETFYIHPTFAPEKRGGYSKIEYALKSQEEHDQLTSGKCFYWMIKDNHGSGYGYSIFERNPNNKVRVVFNQNSKSVCEEMTKKLNDTGHTNVVVLDSQIEYPYLMILKEKYGDHYYYVPDLISLFSISRKIVLERLEEGGWYEYQSDYDERIQKPSLSKDEIAKLPDNRLLKEAALKEWENFEYQLKIKKEDQKEMEDLKFIKENENYDGGRRSYQFLTRRNGSQYETVEFVEFEKI